MAEIQSISEQSKCIRAEFMLKEADVALSFLDLADRTKISEDRQRGRREAGRAYDTILGALPTLLLTTQQRIRLNHKMSFLKVRLQAAAISAEQQR